jgi:hypothetical protein
MRILPRAMPITDPPPRDRVLKERTGQWLP